MDIACSPTYFSVPPPHESGIVSTYRFYSSKRNRHPFMIRLSYLSLAAFLFAVLVSSAGTRRTGCQSRSATGLHAGRAHYVNLTSVLTRVLASDALPRGFFTGKR